MCPSNTSGSYSISTILSTRQFLYVILIATSNSPDDGNMFTGLEVQSVASGGYSGSGLVNNTDFTVTRSTSNGAPIITYSDSTTNNLTYNLLKLLISESCRRLYPKIHDTSNIFFGGSNTNCNISSNSNSTNLCFNYNSTARR